MDTDINNTLVNPNISEADKYKKITKNILKMLNTRVYFDKDDVRHTLLSLDNKINKYHEHDIGEFTVTANNKTKYAIKIFFQRITSLSKQTTIIDFFKDYHDYNKILVAISCKKKIEETIKKNHNTQFFNQAAMMQNIYKHLLQPIECIVLSNKEAKLVKNQYAFDNYTCNRYNSDDAIVKYLNVGSGTIIKIIRPSNTSGISIAYRIVP